MKKPDFPLTLRADGRWCRRIGRKYHYFGRDKQKALELWLEQKDALLAGRDPPVIGATLADLMNAFLYSKSLRLESGELSHRSFNDYERTCRAVGKSVGITRAIDGLTLADFQKLRADLNKGIGLKRLQGELTRARSIFKYANDNGLVERLIPYRGELRSPNKRALDKIKNERGPQMYSRTDIEGMLKGAGTQLRAMIYLGICAGFGNGDCAHLTFRAFDLENGWHNLARPKTGNPRRAKLWPEVIEAIKAVIEVRPEPATPKDADYIFLTRLRRCWSREEGKDAGGNAISSEFRKLMKELKLDDKGFYSLRRTYQTVATAANQPVALSFTMGHVDATMAGTYRQLVYDKYLIEVSEHVRGWLNGSIEL